MVATVEIVTGSAGSGKTAALLARYRTTLASLPLSQLGTTLWITPTNRARLELRGLLLGDDLSVSFSPNILTFEAFAEQILDAAPAPADLLDESRKRVLLRRIIEDLAARDELSYFAPISDTSGFLDLVAGFISELKRDEIWPETFAQACAHRGSHRRDHELAQIYDTYQSHLHRLRLYDAQGRFWSARNALAEGIRGRFDQLSTVIVDGFTDFTHTQYEILTLLSQFARQIIVSLPLESPLARTDLFGKSAVALSRLTRLFPAASQTIQRCETPLDQTSFPAVRHVAENLFGDPRNTTRSSRAENLEVLAAMGRENEFSALALRIKQQLLEGTPAGEIVVVLRSLDEAAIQLVDVFRESGIPVECEAGIPLSRTGGLKALLALLQLELEDWPYERLMACLDSNYFRPDWDECCGDRAVRCVASQLRRHGLSSERRTILSMLASSSGSFENSESNEAVAALTLLRRLDAELSRLRGRHAFETWVDVVLSLAHACGITPATQPESGFEELDAADRRGWELFEGLLYETVGLDARIANNDAPYTLSEFFALLLDLLQFKRVPLTASRRGSVRVLEAAQVRNLEIPHLYVAGLSESAFPAGQSDDCLYSDAERRELNELQIPLSLRASHNQDEMLLFYSVVTRARASLTLSYPNTNNAGQPLFPSPYLTALCDLFEPGAIPHTQVGWLDPVPADDALLTAADFRIAATAGVRRGVPELFRRLVETPESRSVAGNILGGLALNIDRFHTDGFTRYEGLLRAPENLRNLRRHYDGDYEFSTTQFESYADCPFKFFLSSVLEVDALESPEAETDHRTRGTVVHNVLASLHEIAEADDDAQPNWTAQQLADRFRELVEAQLGRRPPDSQLQSALRNVELRLMSDWADAYAEQWFDYRDSFQRVWEDSPSPSQLEVPFGKARDQPGESPQEHFPCLVFEDDDAQTRVCGRIDRIDVGSVDGQSVFNVIDYKSGSPKAFKQDDVSAGKAIQLALYTLAVDRLEIVGHDARPWQMAYWSLKNDGFLSALKQGRQKQNADSPLDEAVLASLEAVLDELIPRLSGAIRNGRFAVHSDDPHCMRYCPYDTVCRVRQIRSIEDVHRKHWEL